MPSLFDKLNLKDEQEIVVLNAPPSFEQALAALDGVRVWRALPQTTTVSFAIAFATAQAEVDALARSIPAASSGDVKFWVAYPKGTSKRYTCEFNRDTGWDALRAAGFDTVRQVAIDDDWSALRFRRTEFIKR